MGSGEWVGGRWETERAERPQARPKTTSSPKNHKDGKKPQARPKTTKTAKNHKPDKKPQSRQKPHHVHLAFLACRGRKSSHLARSALRARDTHRTWINASEHCFWRLFPFLTRNALRAFQKPQARPKTTRSPKNHKDGKKPQGRQKTTKTAKNHNLAKKPQS